MKRIVLSVLSCLTLLSVQPAVLAQSFDEDIHFSSILPEPAQGKVGDKIEVLEFFMYSCPHCYRLEPEVQAWLKTKAEDIVFMHVPAMFGPQANLHAKAYYALQAMGESARLHDAFFHAIHEQRQPLKTLEAVETFLQSQGIDLEKFRQAMRSFAVMTKTNRATALLGRYAIRSVPSVVVDGRYKSGSGLTPQRLVQLVDYLAEKVRQERKAGNP